MKTANRGKTIKKYIQLLVSFILVFAFCTSVFAYSNTGQDKMEAKKITELKSRWKK